MDNASQDTRPQLGGPLSSVSVPSKLYGKGKLPSTPERFGLPRATYKGGSENSAAMNPLQYTESITHIDQSFVICCGLAGVNATEINDMYP